MKLAVPIGMQDSSSQTVTAIVLPPALFGEALKMRNARGLVFLALARVNAQGYLARLGDVMTLVNLHERSVQPHIDALILGGFATAERHQRCPLYGGPSWIALKDLRDYYRVHPRFGVAYETLEKRGYISVEMRRTIAARDGHACRYCGSEDRLNIEHVYPWSRGGKDTEENLVLACWECNNRKRARTPEEAGMVLRGLRGMN